MADATARWAVEVVRTTLVYSLTDGHASMSFDWITGGVPTASDCDVLANAVAEWELDGATPGTSYREFRSSRTTLLAVVAASLDKRSRSVGYVIVPSDVGAGANSTSDPLSDQVAPLMHWVCLPGQARRRGRTYLPGLCHDALDTDRPDYLNVAVSGPLVLCFNGLIELGLARNSSPLVLLTCQRSLMDLRPCEVSVVLGADIGSRLVGTQRRRMPD